MLICVRQVSGAAPVTGDVTNESSRNLFLDMLSIEVGRSVTLVGFFEISLVALQRIGEIVEVCC